MRLSKTDKHSQRQWSRHAIYFSHKALESAQTQTHRFCPQCILKERQTDSFLLCLLLAASALKRAKRDSKRGMKERRSRNVKPFRLLKGRLARLPLPLLSTFSIINAATAFIWQHDNSDTRGTFHLLTAKLSGMCTTANFREHHLFIFFFFILHCRKVRYIVWMELWQVGNESGGGGGQGSFFLECYPASKCSRGSDETTQKTD